MFEAYFMLLIRFRGAVLIAVALWGGIGVWSALRSPVDALPDLSENQVLVYANWDDHYPDEIDREVTRPIAAALEGIPGVVSVRGSSDVGTSLLHFIFNDGVSLKTARDRIRARLVNAKINLPEGVTALLAPDGISTGQIFWYTIQGTAENLAQLREINSNTIIPQLTLIPGVAEVAGVGGFVAEYHIQPDLQKLADSQYTLDDFENALRVSVSKLFIQHASRRDIGNSPSLANDAIVSPDEISDSLTQEMFRIEQLEKAQITFPDGKQFSVRSLGDVSLAASPRRGVFEKDGNEVVGGVIHIKNGANPLAVIRDVRAKIDYVNDHLPNSIRIVTAYDRTPLIQGAIGTVTRTLLESILVTTLCVLIVLRHLRTSLVITVMLLMSVISAFGCLAVLRVLGIADVQSNIMSLAGIVVSIGVLVDSSIVVTDTVTHRLKLIYGDRPVEGDIRRIVAQSCAHVGVPAFLATLILILSFTPVFALSGIDGRMYRPLAWTKTLSLASMALLTVTLLPVACDLLIRGRLRKETDSAIIRSFAGVYRPILAYLLLDPTFLIAMLGMTIVAGASVTGIDWLIRSVLIIALGSLWLCGQVARRKLFLSATLVVWTLFLQSTVSPITLALRLPLDEGMVMDMPITIPRITMGQAADDLKARNMVLCRFPEVRMAIGKAGRADTPFDPAPVDMIETMVEFRSKRFWPSRRLMTADAQRHVRDCIATIADEKMIDRPDLPEALVEQILAAGLIRFDAIQREFCWQRNQSMMADLNRILVAELVEQFVQDIQRQKLVTRDISLSAQSAIVDQVYLDVNRQRTDLLDATTIHSVLRDIRSSLHKSNYISSVNAATTVNAALGSTFTFARLFQGNSTKEAVYEASMVHRLQKISSAEWAKHITSLNAELRKRVGATWTHVVLSEIFQRLPITDSNLAAKWDQVLAARYGVGRPLSHHTTEHIGIESLGKLPIVDPYSKFDTVVKRLSDQFSRRAWLWPHDTSSLTSLGGEMDLAVQMPGWANVWTRPIQNRVDMLATGVNSEIGVRVLGKDFDTVVRFSEQIAAVVRDLPGAIGVVADPVREKNYVDVLQQPDKIAQHNLDESSVEFFIAVAKTGIKLGAMEYATGKRNIRLVLANFGDDPESLLNLPIDAIKTNSPTVSNATVNANHMTLGNIATVQHSNGPATIKSENGLIRNYVRLNVQGISPLDFVNAAKQRVQESLVIPPDVRLEWTGQFEHAAETRQTMLWMIPIVLLVILGILFLVFRDFADAGLMMLSVPGAIAGGILCQWLLGVQFSIAVGIGYISCFGMAAATSVVMLIFLRESVANSGGLEKLSLSELRETVIRGAVQRLRPKLLTELTLIVSLAPMIWSSGVGADVIRPMAAPVLGGILIADEVVDLLIPVAFYAVRRRRWRKLHDEVRCPELKVAK